jgi:4-hydroxy-tetrahydrodipicolinate synthase
MKDQKSTFEGIITYPITPFDELGKVDGAALEALIDRLVNAGSNAIAPLGSTGESAYLNDDEWAEVAETSISAVAGRLPVIVGISDITTRGAISRAKIAERLGADAIMVLPASYWKLSDEEVFQHYQAIASSVGLPIMVYNNPATSGIDMSPELICRMFRAIDNVTMVKESTGDIQRMHKISALTQDELPFYNGSNPLALEAFAAGASGWCTAAPNLIDDWPLKLYLSFQDNDVKRARAIFYKQLPLLEFILKGGLPTTVKAGLSLRGLNAGSPRKPLRPLSSADTQELEVLLQALSGT